MDGGGRLLRSIGELGARLTPSSFAIAGPYDPFSFPKLPQTAPQLPSARRRRSSFAGSAARGLLASRCLGTTLALSLLTTAAAFGAIRGGAYDQLTTAYGSLPDMLAKTAGFSIKAVTINGAKQLTQRELLAIAGVNDRRSLVFLDVADVRARLKAVPLIKDASVTKLYPNRLAIELEERQPTALWQKDGVLSLVAADGTPIDNLHDARFETLPLVVGDGANGRIADYVAILDSAGELRDRVRAGIYVSGRRWTLRIDSGIDIDLPEVNAPASIEHLAKLEHDSHILEKDIVSLDLRISGRVVARLAPDAAAARAELLAKKTKKKGATT